MTIGERVREVERRLSLAGVDSPRLEAQVLVASALEMCRSQLLARVGDAFPADASLEDLVRRRELGEPLAYVLGTREFFGRSFKVGPGVLVPRGETEVLVQAALARAPLRARIVDIGTGSGCIAITLNLERPDLIVTAVDVSADACAYARENAARLYALVEVVEADLSDTLASGEYDLIVTNPPYVAWGDELPAEIREHEPAGALFAGEDGLDFYRRLAQSGKRIGWLLTEIGDGMESSVVDVFERAGWSLASLQLDLMDKVRVLEFKASDSPRP